MAAATALALLIWLAPAPAEPCPTWSERQTMECMRGYLRVDPGALAIAFEDEPKFDARRLGFQTGLGAGVFGKFGGFGFAAGVRAAYAFYRIPRSWAVYRDDFVHVGPELRLGHARERVFVYGLFRGGFSAWREHSELRTSVVLVEDRGRHLGFGAGAWGRVHRRLLVGGEVVVDIVRLRHFPPLPAVLLALSLGAWL